LAALEVRSDVERVVLDPVLGEEEEASVGSREVASKPEIMEDDSLVHGGIRMVGEQPLDGVD
jgi:hypothetical protein